MLDISSVDAVSGAGDVGFVDDGGATGVIERHDDEVEVLKGHLPWVRI